MGTPRIERSWFTTDRLRSLILLVFAVGLIAVGWRFFAPVQLGGGASYVSTEGTSMLPHFRSDGLVITHTRSSYSVGDVVAYHNLQLHTVVMHRIVGIVHGQYIFKGDNNDFRDSFRPTKSQLVGEEALYIPGAGRLVGYLRQPVDFAVVMALFGLAIGSSIAKSSGRHGQDAE